MTRAFFILACVSAVLMWIFSLVGCIDIMVPRDPPKTKREQGFRLFDVLILRGAVWSVQTFKANWSSKPFGRKLLYWALGFLAAFFLFCGLTIYQEIAKQ